MRFFQIRFFATQCGTTPPHAAYTELLLSSVPEMDPDWLTQLLAARGASGQGQP